MEKRNKAIERMVLAAGRLANEPRISKKLQYRFVRTLAYGWMRPIMARRSYVENVDWLIAPPSDRGVVFACNHRSFFDSHLYLFSLYASGAKWPRNLYFPVRSNFFYDSAAGMAVNFAVGGGIMYPPIYRDVGRKTENSDALERICKFIDQPNSVVGLHPEGRRNKGDPYKLLPAQPGIGEVVLKSKPLVVPVFVNGLDNDFVQSIRDSFASDAKLNNPLTIVFGEPVDYSEFTTAKPRASLYKRCADKIIAAVATCGEREREIRTAILSGDIAEDDPHWLWQAKQRK